VRIAHISDLHIVALEGAVPWRLFNKRITGYVNLELVRRNRHQLSTARAVAADLRRRAVDHVVVTGDLTNLALEREYEAAVEFLQQELGLPAREVSVVPGNHDAYTRGAVRSGRFAHYLRDFISSDLSLATNGHPAEVFPFVRLRGAVAIIGLCSAVARPPLMASGVLGDAQRDALERALAHPEVRRRSVVVLQHHPLHNPANPLFAFLRGLDDSRAERRALAELPNGLVLHGHLHRRLQRTIPTAGGELRFIGTTSTSLVHADPDRMAGYNVYELDDDGALVSVEAFRLDPATGRVDPAPIPVRPA
jgi:3',5'-cyclic AMP phosphodiesterase CpdA